MLAFSAEAEKRWRSKNEEDKQNELYDEISGPFAREHRQRKEYLKRTLPKGKALSVIVAREVFGNLLINLRSPSASFRWEGDWSFGSERWDDKIKQ